MQIDTNVIPSHTLATKFVWLYSVQRTTAQKGYNRQELAMQFSQGNVLGRMQ